MPIDGGPQVSFKIYAEVTWLDRASDIAEATALTSAFKIRSFEQAVLDQVLAILSQVLIEVEEDL